ncbi:DegT/DnrJ/EryC1/StrS family aminotransferase [Streptomyces lydicus]|uniref:DegT/DnrJ/EryC1/StrS family aminotransferase n=1 Tax=Streptomyces lydicus TaxID=47763 RepID=UPI00341E84B5
MRRVVAQANQYPPFHADQLTEKIAELCGVAPDCVAVGSGSVGVALQLLQAVVRRGDTVAYAWRTFDAYPLLAEMVGARPAPVPLLPDGRQDLAALLAVLGPRTRVVVRCRPSTAGEGPGTSCQTSTDGNCI